MAKKGNLHIFPSLVCLITPITFIVTLAIATKLNHVYWFLPYISDTGNEMPESCIFSQCLNITAVLLLMCVYVRYLQVKSLATFKTPIGPHLTANDISWYLGFASCLGLDIVANFQVHNIMPVHYLGALLCFVGGSIYFVFQTIFSYHLSKVDDSKYLFYIRCVLCVLSGLLCVSAIFNGAMSTFHMHPAGEKNELWTYEESGYVWHLLSTSCEWLLAVTQSVLVLTFLPEFKRITLYSPKFEIEGIHVFDDSKEETTGV